MDQPKTKAGNSSENASESLPPQPPRKKKNMEDQRLKKTFELLTACANQAMNDKYQYFGKMLAAELRNCNDTVRCVIQNEIMGVFLNVNTGFYGRYQHTHLHPNNPPQAHFPSGPSNMYPQSINPPPHTSPSSLHSQKPSLSPFSQYNNSLFSQVFSQKAFRQLRNLQRKILIYKCF